MFFTIVIIVAGLGLFLYKAMQPETPEAAKKRLQVEAQNRTIVCQHCHKPGGVTRGSARVRVAHKAWDTVPQLNCSNCGVTWRP